MTFISDLQARVDSLAALPELHVATDELPAVIDALPDDAVESLLTGGAALRRCVELMTALAAGVAGRRSTRERGNGGMAAVRGHRTTVSLVQSITGGTAADAKRAVKVGESLLEATEPTPDADESPAPAVRWHEPLARARLQGIITSEQHDAIRAGLGEPPAGDDAEAAREVWSIACEQLILAAASENVEELRRRARTMRDMLDPAGAHDRFTRHFETRSWRIWSDADGRRHARIDMDDEMGLWFEAMRDAALRPRRGGPRFLTDEERAAADALAKDPRTNDQLTYDLFMDVMRAGALAGAKDVFGARQPGVRMLVVKDAVGPRDAFGRLLATGHAEDRGDALPGAIIDRSICMNGTVDVVFDAAGNPLDLGREQRCFSPKQRIALAARDGGCAMTGCSVPASYCEAHHCDHWLEHQGRTDIDRGILLCRFHHLWVHNFGYRITRDGKGPFVLHAPPGRGDPVRLEPKPAWAWAWSPPPLPDRAPWREVPASLPPAEPAVRATA